MKHKILTGAKYFSVDEIVQIISKCTTLDGEKFRTYFELDKNATMSTFSSKTTL